MKKNVTIVALLVFVLLLSSCATLSKTNVAVVTYESTAIALHTAYVYLTAREANRTLVGEELVKAKQLYRTARQHFLEAGDMLSKAVETPTTFDQATYISLLEEAARLAASLSKGGR